MVWGVVVALVATGLGALLLAIGLLLWAGLTPGPGILLAISLAAVAVGALWASRRAGHAGLLVGGAVGLGYALLSCVLAGVFHLGALSVPGLVQALAAAVVVGAVAGIIGVNL
jgi:putative membrane protein (TIGR04086 family)